MDCSLNEYLHLYYQYFLVLKSSKSSVRSIPVTPASSPNRRLKVVSSIKDIKAEKSLPDTRKSEDFDPFFKDNWLIGESKKVDCFVYSILPKNISEWTQLVCPMCMCYKSQTCKCRIERVQTFLIALHLISYEGSCWTLKSMISGEDGQHIFLKMTPETLKSYEKDGIKHSFTITKYQSISGSIEPYVFICQDIK